MDSQFECDWDRLMNHSCVWDLPLIRLSLRERKKTDTDWRHKKGNALNE